MNLENIVDNEKTDKGTVHSYLPEYQKLFGKIREDVRNVLEIGIGGGGSLVLWNDFFPNATIYGIDNRDELRHQFLKDDYKRIKVLTPYDAYNSKTLDLFKDIQFDIIIDDGPHTLESQIYCAKHYIKLLKKGGTLAIEDIENGQNIHPVVDAFDDANRVECIDLRAYKARYDDILIIYEN